MSGKIVHTPQPPVEPVIDEIVSMIGRGKSLSAACDSFANGPNLNAVRRWLRAHPNGQARVKAARLVAGGTSRAPSRFTPHAWEAGLLSIETYSGALSSLRVPGQPHIDELRRRATRDLAFADRLRSAFDKRKALGIRKRRFTSDDYTRALALLEDTSRSMEVIDADLRKENLPALGTIYGRRYRDSALATSFADRITATRGIFHFGEEAYAEAISILSTDPMNARVRIKASAGRLPSFNAIHGRAATSAPIAAMFQDYRERSRSGRLERRTERARLRQMKKPVFKDGVLRSGLLLDELYREASALFHAGIDERDDMISEVVVAVLQGDLAREDIGSRGKAIGFAALKGHSSKRTDSLDRSIARDGSGVTMGEMMSADLWSLEDAV